jgi:TRAP-type C4-dicarboxylate transport system permease small subunit
VIKQSVKLIAHLFWVIHKIEEWLLVALTALLVILASSQILLRNIFDSGMPWNEPLLRILVMWIGLLGALVATRENRHINIDLVSRMVPKHYRHLIELINHLFTAFICFVIAEFSRRFIILEMEDGIEAFNGVPAWPFELIIPIAFALMALRASYFFFMHLHLIWEKK